MLRVYLAVAHCATVRPMGASASRWRTLLELDLDGEIHGFVHALGAGTAPFRVAAASTWNAIVPGFRGVAEVRSIPGRAASLFGGGGDGGTAEITIPRRTLDLWAMRTRVALQRSRGRILWWEEGGTYADAIEVHRGLIRSPTFDRGPDGDGSCSFSLAPAIREIDARFPPALVGDEGRFPNAVDRAKTQAVPVIYGTVKGLPLYRIAATGPGPVIHLLIAGHPITSTDLNGLLAYTDGALLLAGPRPVLTAIDGIGGVYSYVDVTAGEYLADANIHVTEVTGWVGPTGVAIDRLGDVLIHAWRQYSGEPLDGFDEFRAEFARPRLNRYRVGAAFNAAESQGTLIRALESRFAPQFPVVFSFVGGKLGWDAVDLPSEAEALGSPLRTLTYGVDASGRSGLGETSADEVRDDLRLEYGLDGFDGGSLSSTQANPTNSEMARQARSLWGQGPRVDLSSPDIPDSNSAYALITDHARRLSEVRTRVSYSGLDASWYGLPLLGVVHVTDADLGWTSVPCLIEVLQPRADGRMDVALITYRSGS